MAIAHAWFVVGGLVGCGQQPAPLPDVAAELTAEWLTDGVGDVHAGVPLVVDPTLRDGVTALADCAATVSVCLERTQGDFGTCVQQAPACSTVSTTDEEPPCCPHACKEQFEARTGAGASGYDAYVEVFAFDGSCVDGLQPLSSP